MLKIDSSWSGEQQYQRGVSIRY